MTTTTNALVATSTGRNVLQRLVALTVTVLVALGSTIGLSACGQVWTLQNLMTQEELQQMQSSNAIQGFSNTVAVKDNNITFTYTVNTGDSLSDSAAYLLLGFSDWDSVYASMEDTASSVISNIENEYGVGGVTITMIFKSADGSTISEHTFS